MPYGLGGLVMQQISAMHPAWAELSPAELPSAELPLAGRLREWTAAWRRGEALGQRIARDLVFTSLLDVLPCSGSQRALAGASVMASLHGTCCGTGEGQFGDLNKRL